MVTTARLDYDWDDFDPKFFPKKVYKDGRGPRVTLMLTDAVPPASRHRSHRSTVLDSAELRDARQRAEDAYQANKAWLQDAWRGPGSRLAPPPREGESPRDAWIRQMSNAWRTAPGQDPDNNDPNPVEAQRRRWLSPGATPGPGPSYGDSRPAASRETATDAAAARDQAYREYVDRISDGWRR
jgi:hypothetical protein